MSDADDSFQVPGGLRTQLLASLAFLLVGTLALVALAFVQLLERHVRQTEIQQTFQLTDHLVDTTLGTDTRRNQQLDQAMGTAIERTMRHYPQIVGASLQVRDPGPTPLLVQHEEGIVPGMTDADGRHYKIIEHDGQRLIVTRVRLQEGPSTADASSGKVRSATVARTLEPAFDRVRQMRDLLLAYLAIDALFVIIVGYALLTFLVVRPIRAIGVATRRAARGDLASHIDLQPPNEFGTVARSFNEMLDELRHNRQRLRERIEELDDAYHELEETQQTLIRSEKLASVGRLAAGVAHEIGNPLSAVTGYLDMLEDDEIDDETRRDIVERSQTQLRRIRTIIRDLLDFSRQDPDIDARPVDPAECLVDAIDLVEPQPRTRAIEITLELPDQLPRVTADPAQLTQVFVNLILNAADAIRSERDTDADDRAPETPVGHVRIDASRPSRDADEAQQVLQIHVTDDGPGIPSDEQSDIFDPFFTTKEPGEGTGLGLAVSLRIVERFDGDISVTSPVDCMDDHPGTRFTVSLPVADE